MACSLGIGKDVNVSQSGNHLEEQIGFIDRELVQGGMRGSV